MSKRMLDHLLAEDVLLLKDGLRRAEDVEARVETPPAEDALAAAAADPVEASPTIAAARRATRGERSRKGLVVGLLGAAALMAGSAWFLFGRNPPSTAPEARPAPPAAAAPVTAPVPTTAAVLAVTEPPAGITAPDSATAAADSATAVAAQPAAPSAARTDGPPTVPASKAEEQKVVAPPPAPVVAEQFWIVAGPFQDLEAARGVKAHAPDLQIREDVRPVKLTAHVVRSEAPTSEADARTLADQMTAYGITAALEPDGDGVRLSVGPLASPSAAEQAATLLLSLGHPAGAARVQVDGVVVYVDVGPIADELRATELSKTIQERMNVRTGLKREALTP